MHLVRLRRAAMTLLLLSGLSHAQPVTPITRADAVNSARSFGAARLPQIASDVNTTKRMEVIPPPNVTRDCVPQLAATEAHYGGGNGDLGSASGPMLANAATGNSPECTAINFMQGKSSTPNPITINPVDPILVQARSLQTNPAPALGSTMGMFVPRPTSSCQPGSVTTGGTPREEVCYEFAALTSGTCEKPWVFLIKPWWEYTCEKEFIGSVDTTCSKTENPTVTYEANCLTGATLGTVTVNRDGGPPTIDNVTISSICELNNSILTFKTSARGLRGGCIGEQTFSTPRDVTSDTYAADLAPHWRGGCRDITVVTKAGSKCTNGTCKFTWQFGSPTVACPAGRTSGDSFFFSNGYSITPGDAAVCYVQSPAVIDPSSGIAVCQGGLTAAQTGGGNTVCLDAGVPATMTGVSGPQMSLSFREPKNMPIVTENVISTCGALEGNAQCQNIGSQCIDGPGATRIINGHPITKACWKTEYTYQCLQTGTVNNCSGLMAEPLCAQIGVEECLEYAANNTTCKRFKARYKCEKDMAGTPFITQTAQGYDIVKDALDESACGAFAQNPNCTRTANDCVDSADKTFFGLTFSKSCWKFVDAYTCQRAAPDPQAGCQPLIDAGCKLIAGSEACTTILPDGACGALAKTYQCGATASTVATGAVCDAQPYCINGICYDTSRPADPDFGRAVAMMEAARQAGHYMDVDTFEIFKGEAAQCRRKVFGVTNCCKNDAPTGGSSSTNAAMYTAFSFGKRFVGSMYVYDSIFRVLPDLAIGLSSIGVTSAAGANAFSAYGVTVGWGANGLQFIGFDPLSFAFAIAVQLILSEVMSCPSEDKLTALKRAQGICHHVGTYCSSKSVGGCTTERESYCCFNSKLARILNVAGKAQLGISFGTPQNPDCRGLTVAQLQNLDFSLIDLSEFIADIVSTAMPTSEAVANVTNRLTNYSPMAPATVVPDATNTAGGGRAVNCATAPVGTPGCPPPPAASVGTPPQAIAAPPADVPEPTITASISPNPGIHGSNLTFTTNTTNATAVVYECTGAWPRTGNIVPGLGVNTVIPIPVGPIGPSTCRFTALNSVYDVTVEVLHSVFPPGPSVSLVFSPNPVAVGGSYTFTTVTSGADELTYVCGGARSGSGSLPVGAHTSSPAVATALQQGVTTCTLTAKNTATGQTGTTTVQHTTNAVAPSVSVSASPQSVQAGNQVVMTISTMNAATVTYVCTGGSPRTGSVASGTQPVNFATVLANVGTTVCQVTATSVSGQVATASTNFAVTP